MASNLALPLYVVLTKVNFTIFLNKETEILNELVSLLTSSRQGRQTFRSKSSFPIIVNGWC